MKFDVFLCHNSKDKPAVEAIALKLKERNLKPWLDKWELQPGFPWQPELEKQIDQIQSAAVFVGDQGIGPWQRVEIQAYLQRLVTRGCPVIPVLLENCSQVPEIPIFLSLNTWVDFRSDDPDPMNQLVWGITGDKAYAQAGVTSSPKVQAKPSLSIAKKNYLEQQKRKWEEDIEAISKQMSFTEDLVKLQNLEKQAAVYFEKLEKIERELLGV